MQHMNRSDTERFIMNRFCRLCSDGVERMTSITVVFIRKPGMGDVCFVFVLI
jgi:hypothetical protein